MRASPALKKNASAPQKGRLLRVREAAEELAVSAKVVYRLCESGDIPHHRIGVGRGSIRIRREDLDVFIDDCRVESVQDELCGYDHLA